MNQASLINSNTNRKNLQQLIILRVIAVIAQIITITIAVKLLHIKLPIKLMLMVIMGLILFSVLSVYHLKKNSISDKNLFGELLIDVGAFALQIYFSGGVSNPFIALFLLQVIIGVIILKPLFAWLIGIITSIFYIILSIKFYDVGLATHSHGNHHADFNLHLQGMVLSHIIITILILIFIGKIIRNIRDGEEKIHQLEQQFLREKQLVEIALFTTNSAHHLGSPLSTIAVIINDWKKILRDQNILEDINLIEHQLQKCKNILSNILDFSGATRLDDYPATLIKESCQNLINGWHNCALIKNLTVNYHCDPNLIFYFDKNICKAIYNIFDNAYEAHLQQLVINFGNDQKNLIIEVIDDGAGFEEYILKNLGKTHLSSKNSQGIGIYLTINTLQRIGGNLEIKNNTQGASVKITLPLQYHT